MELAEVEKFHRFEDKRQRFDDLDRAALRELQSAPRR